MQTSSKIFTLTNTYTGGGNGYLPPITVGDFNKDGYPDFIAVKCNPVGGNNLSNEVELFSNNSGSGSFAEIPLWTDATMQYSGEALYTIGSSGDIKGDGNTDFVIGRNGMVTPSTPTWIQVWYCAPLGNSISFETQIVDEGNLSGNGKGFIADVNSDGIGDIVTQDRIYYGYTQSAPVPVPGGGGGPVGPVAAGFSGLLAGLKKRKKI
jgi:hypothetical protein